MGRGGGGGSRGGASFNAFRGRYNRSVVQREAHRRIARGQDITLRTNARSPLSINRYSEPRFTSSGVYVNSGRRGQNRVFIDNDDLARGLGLPTALSSYLANR